MTHIFFVNDFYPRNIGFGKNILTDVHIFYIVVFLTMSLNLCFHRGSILFILALDDKQLGPSSYTKSGSENTHNFCARFAHTFCAPISVL